MQKTVSFNLSTGSKLVVLPHQTWIFYCRANMCDLIWETLEGGGSSCTSCLFLQRVGCAVRTMLPPLKSNRSETANPVAKGSDRCLQRGRVLRR